jgi:hypothetical protein
MSKKTFTGGIDALLGERKDNRGRPKTVSKEVTKSSQEGTKENETRATFIVNEDVLEKVKAIAYWERVKIKDVVATALMDSIKKYEKNNGAVKLIPKDK